jgi:hypothetical protein
MNNNLIIFYKDKSKDVFSFSLDTDEQSALEAFDRLRPNVNKSDIEKYFYEKGDSTSPDTYGHHSELKKGKISINVRSIIASKKIEEVRKKRDAILANLDVPFMKSLELDNPSVKNQIVLMKNFLRDLPQNLNLHKLTEEEIIKLNPFGNIFEIALIESAIGYTKAPEIIIDPPKSGAQAKAMTFIKDGKISKIEITDYGNGYDFVPRVLIEDFEGKESVAVCGLPQNCFLTEDKIFQNTIDHYRKAYPPDASAQ